MCSHFGLLADNLSGVLWQMSIQISSHQPYILWLQIRIVCGIRPVLSKMAHMHVPMVPWVWLQIDWGRYSWPTWSIVSADMHGRVVCWGSQQTVRPRRRALHPKHQHSNLIEARYPLKLHFHIPCVFPVFSLFDCKFSLCQCMWFVTITYTKLTWQTYPA